MRMATPAAVCFTIAYFVGGSSGFALVGSTQVCRILFMFMLVSHTRALVGWSGLIATRFEIIVGFFFEEGKGGD